MSYYEKKKKDEQEVTLTQLSKLSIYLVLHILYNMHDTFYPTPYTLNTIKEIEHTKHCTQHIEHYTP